MDRLRRLMILLVPCSARCSRPPAAHADASPDPTGFRLSVIGADRQRERRSGGDHGRAHRHERGGPDPLHHARRRRQVRRQAECTAVDPDDFHSVKGELDFPAGVASETFTVPIVDHGVQTVPKTIQVSLFGPSPIGMALAQQGRAHDPERRSGHAARPPEPARPPGRSGRRQSTVRRELLRRPRERGRACGARRTRRST